MARAELINLVVYFAKNPRLIIGDRVVLDSFMSELFSEPVHDLHFLKVYHYPTARSALKIMNDVRVCSKPDRFAELLGLDDTELNNIDFGDEREHKVQSWLGPTLE